MTPGRTSTGASLAAIGFAGCAVGLLVDPKIALASYLTAWFAVSAIPIGAIAVLFTSYLVRAGWTRDLHEPLSDAALTMPVVAAAVHSGARRAWLDLSVGGGPRQRCRRSRPPI